MNVERVRTFEAEPAASSSEKMRTKGSGFSDLMDSVLGPAVEDRPSAQASSQGRDESAAADSSGAAREPVRDEAGSSEPTPERARQDERAAEDGLLAVPGVPAYELAVPLGIPVFEGLAIAETAQAVDPAEMAVEELDSGAAGEDAAFDGSTGGRVFDREAQLAEATNGRSILADPSARQGFQAALESARAGKGEEAVAVETKTVSTPEENRIPGTAPAVEREAAPAPGSSRIAETALEVDQSAPLATRAAPAAEEARRGELEALPVRADGASNGQAGSQTDRGSDDSSGERRRETPEPAIAPVERVSGDSSSAGTSPVVEAADAGRIETPLRSEDTSGQARQDAPTPTVTTTRAPELPPALQSGRAFPTPASDTIAIQADWLATRGGGTARLVLSPPELGEIAIRVTVRQQSVEVVMVAQTALAHSMAEDQGDRLAQAFANRDLRLDQFEVRRGDPTDSSSTGQFGSSDAGTRERDRADDESGVDRGAASGRGSARRGGVAEMTSPPPQVVSNGRAAGIDLRI